MGAVRRQELQNLVISRLSPDDTSQLSDLLSGDDSSYGSYFNPFPAGKESLETRLKNAVKDHYWGIWFGDELAGFFMLRGFDDGHQRPSFGVYIAKIFANRGLLKLALAHSISWCRLNGVHAMMVKVHPNNKYAADCYKKTGFKFLETCPQTGHTVMEIQWGNPL